MGKLFQGIGNLIGSIFGIDNNPPTPPTPPPTDIVSNVGVGPENKGAEEFKGDTQRTPVKDTRKRGTKSLQIPLDTPVTTTPSQGINVTTKGAGGLQI